MTLFDDEPQRIPLTEQLRPTRLLDVVGQAHLADRLGVLAHAPHAVALILTGPPGTGKTTIARLLARERGEHLVELHASDTGLRELREAREHATLRRRVGSRTLWFVDEVHRLSRTQLDALLAPLELGEVSFIGATTENPAVTLSSALLSRCEVLTLRPLSVDALSRLAERAFEAMGLTADEATKALLVRAARGDGRALVRMVERSADLASAAGSLEPQALQRVIDAHNLGLDASTHYEFASALIKSMRDSREEDALFWLAAAIDAGEDPRFIARRLAIFASEDVGLADNQAILIAEAAAATVERIGMPEARITLAHAVIYLSRAPKSREAYDRIELALRTIASQPRPSVPEERRGAVVHFERRYGITRPSEPS